MASGFAEERVKIGLTSQTTDWEFAKNGYRKNNQSNEFNHIVILG